MYIVYILYLYCTGFAMNDVHAMRLSRCYSQNIIYTLSHLNRLCSKWHLIPYCNFLKLLDGPITAAAASTISAAAASVLVVVLYNKLDYVEYTDQ